MNRKTATAILILRLVMGWIFFYEGAGKLFGWFSGGGIESIVEYFHGLGIPFPRFSAYLVGWTELISGLLFISGVLVKSASLLIAIIMATAIFTAHRSGGFNYPLLILSVCILLFSTGAGISWYEFPGLCRRCLKK